MDVKEKIIDILENSFKKQYEKRGLLTAPHTAADLIYNGVTVQEYCKDCAEATQNCIVKLQEQIAELRSLQEWIPAGEPPKERGEYLCYFKYEPESPDVIFQNTYYGSGRWMSEQDRVTHWQYLPHPPKGE